MLCKLIKKFKKIWCTMLKQVLLFLIFFVWCEISKQLHNTLRLPFNTATKSKEKTYKICTVKNN